MLKLNFKGLYPSSEREIRFRRCLFTSSIKCKIRHFHVVVVQKQERNVQKKCDARAKLLFCFLKPIVFVDVLVAVASLNLKVPSDILWNSCHESYGPKDTC